MIRRHLVLVAALSLFAAPVPSLLAPAVAGAEMPGVTRTRLPNGLSVIVRENNAAPLVAYSLLVKMGTRNETPETAGISNLLQLMVVRGTEKMSGEEIAAAADRLGGSIDAYADADYSEITATALSRNWQAMLEIVGDVTLRPNLPDGTLNAVRDFLVRQIRNRGEKPFDVASDQTRIALFGPRHPYSWDPIGRSEAVRALNRDTVLAWYRRQYVPSNMVLAVSGDVKSSEVMPVAQRLFGGMPAGKADAPTVPAPPAMTATREVFKVPGAQAQIFMSTLAPAFTHPDYPALKVMSAILGGGMASRFFSELRDQQALAYATATLYPPRLDTGSWIGLLGTGPGNVSKAEAALKDQLRRIQTEPASEQEVAVARSYVVGTQLMDRRTNARQAWYLAAAEVAGLPPDYFETYAANVKKVTGADVMRVAKQYLGVVRTVIVQPD
jgi:zinc protease